MSKIFLTGGTGFLGSHIAESLVAEGHQVTCSVRRTSDTRWLDPLGVQLVELDLGSDEAIKEAASTLAGFDSLIAAGGASCG